jgi:hypothetical protein
VKHRLLHALDSAAHFLHLPRWLLKVACDPYEQSIWAGFREPECRYCDQPGWHQCSDGEWFEEDEDPARVFAAFDHGPRGVTAPPPESGT